MGYSQEHIAATRARILEQAGRLFRAHGYGGVSIDQIMQAAGLTRGGFYAHFKNKEALFTAVLEQELDFTNQLRRHSLRAIDFYLNPEYTNRVAPGCTMVSSAADLSRASDAARRAYTGSFENLVQEFQALVFAAANRTSANAADPADRSRALAAVATCAGAVSIARSLEDPALAAELLAASRAAVYQSLGRSSEAGEAAAESGE